MTTKRDVLEICCKVLGLMCLIYGVGFMPSMVSEVVGWINHGGGLSSSFGMPYVAAVQFVAAFFLLKYAGRIASLLMREDSTVQIGVGRDWKRSIYLLAMRVVGAVALIKGIPDLIRVLVDLGAYHQIGSAHVGAYIWGRLAAAVVCIALAVYFIGGAPLIVKVVLKGSMRESASDNNAPPAPAPGGPSQ